MHRRSKNVIHACITTSFQIKSSPHHFVVVIVIIGLFQRHRGFLQSLLREANAKRRNVMLDLANKKQLNALSEMVLNLMKQNVPIQPKAIQKLKCYKNVL